MVQIVGVRLKKTGAVRYFDPNGVGLETNDYVVVETIRGLELAQVAVMAKQVVASAVTKPLKPIVRKAEPEDIQRVQELEVKEREAVVECGKLAEQLNLPMKVLLARYDFDGKRVSIYFRAAERVDFRALVRDLAGQLKVRVDFRQTRPRDEAKLLGGCGRCGRELCCAGFLTEFAPVSIKMAKVQNLPLNPMKISGVCDRLMCCLVYENAFYQALMERLPRYGQRVSTTKGIAKVVGTNPLKETVLVELAETQATLELPLSELTMIHSGYSPEPSTKS
ncbi:MAG: stage 0 sporulation family protein [Dehalococcoidales bacterium]|jgi:cell fate regulator YaaT (PSP1 superfamily)|nr:stage 0 sporulation family protein [Dehalococcoidales bacterium]MDP6221625.1 stage 0 sporulation family protein [Dehalococcoidales bacterium]MDP7109952.1 stage 0 sporulation family protein [Dehalococcoidales bacterium]MDP7309702.1 stage 0 sporulation family protein [Dehalococcoidales bacterium]MDP7409365.1 stage 0 sporulation family protein [Dehalococcoidales bacterium]|tara:strand:- start:867 stop:1703 length:837 start_codon:yes stop_codon:yes gene_type:complete